MTVLLILIAAVLSLACGYFVYGRWLATKLFALDPTFVVPSIELQDDHDFVPTPVPIVFGHHFTSIAGTGPIVGPALAIMWGWGRPLSGSFLAQFSSEACTTWPFSWSVFGIAE